MNFYPIRRTVTKESENKGRVFYACSKPEGDRCGYFRFAEDERYVDFLIWVVDNKMFGHTLYRWIHNCTVGRVVQWVGENSLFRM